MLNTEQLKENFKHRFVENPTAIYFSPGRVNLIGEHIDYNGGSVFPVAISLGITALVSTRTDNNIKIYAQEFEEEFTIQIQKQYDINHHSNWMRYVLATLQVLSDNGVSYQGTNIYLASDLPLGAGLSSSAALECLIAFIFNEQYYDSNRTQLALDAQLAERKYVGVNCGIMDQFAVAHGKKNNAILLDCNSLEYKYCAANFGEYKIVIINSNKPRALAESKYNERRSECEKAFSLLQNFDIAESLCNVHQISLAYLEDDILYQRAKHAITENERVMIATELLQKNEINGFGNLLTLSHQSLAEDYEVSCHELDIIVEYATKHDACIGARMTGAGFGGCCIALVEEKRKDDFITYIETQYKTNTEYDASFYICDISDGIRRIE